MSVSTTVPPLPAKRNLDVFYTVRWVLSPEHFSWRWLLISELFSRLLYIKKLYLFRVNFIVVCAHNLFGEMTMC
jgi:hypothetical protein